MATRFSTEIIKRQGVRKSVKNIEDKFVNTFQESLGGERAGDAASFLLSSKRLQPGAINSEQYQVARSFFNARGLSETSATTLALLMLDVAKITGVTVMRVLEPLSENEDLIFDYATYVQMNYFRPSSSQQGLLDINDNSQSLRSRIIIP